MNRQILDVGRWWLVLLALPLVSWTGCGEKKAGGPPGRGGPGGFALPPTPVEVARATRGPMEDRFTTIGSFEASEAVTIVSEIDGVVVEIPFAEGRPIGRGGVIARLDDAQLAAEVKRAEALRDQSRAAFERVREVVEANAGSEQDLDDADAALKVAEADLSLARTRLAKTRVTAPFDGVTGARRISTGAFVRAGEAMTSLSRIAELRVIFSAPERLLALVAPGSVIDVSSNAYPGLQAQGTVSVVESMLDPETRTARVVATMKNPEGRFRPGMSAAVSIQLSARAEAIAIPSEAVVVEGNEAFVYRVAADSTVARTPVTMGLRLADVVEITDGLEDGAMVVRAGHQKLYPGARVAPIESRRGAGDGSAAGGGR